MTVELYTWTRCPFCIRAKDLLTRKGIEFTEHVMDGRDRELAEVKQRYGHPTVPIVLIDGELIGGSDELEVLAARGELDSPAQA